MARRKLSRIHLAILQVLTERPEGATIREIRDSIEWLEPGSHQHLDRRVRELDPFYLIDRNRHGAQTVYTLRGERPDGERRYESISKTVRAKVFHKAGMRCQMCGRTVADDEVRLHIDHRIPQEWGGETTEENLWALCSVCNEGKKNYFASFDPDLMQAVLRYPSVHKRIAELLRLKQGEWVPSDLIEFVANFQDFQQDWHKRLRELRYLGLEIEATREKLEKRSTSSYRLVTWIELPDNPSKAAREYERQRAKRNRKGIS